MKMTLSVFLFFFSFNSFGFEKLWSDVFFVKAEEKTLSKARMTHRAMVVREIGYYKGECDIDEGTLTYTSPTPQCQELSSGMYRCHNVVSVTCEEKSRALKELPWADKTQLTHHGKTMGYAKESYDKGLALKTARFKKTCDSDKGVFHPRPSEKSCKLLSKSFGYVCMGDLTVICTKK